MTTNASANDCIYINVTRSPSANVYFYVLKKCMNMTTSPTAIDCFLKFQNDNKPISRQLHLYKYDNQPIRCKLITNLIFKVSPRADNYCIFLRYVIQHMSWQLLSFEYDNKAVNRQLQSWIFIYKNPAHRLTTAFIWIEQPAISYFHFLNLTAVYQLRTTYIYIINV